METNPQKQQTDPQEQEKKKHTHTHKWGPTKTKITPVLLLMMSSNFSLILSLAGIKRVQDSSAN